jgi:hypothetical protein
MRTSNVIEVIELVCILMDAWNFASEGKAGKWPLTNILWDLEAGTAGRLRSPRDWQASLKEIYDKCYIHVCRQTGHWPPEGRPGIDSFCIHVRTKAAIIGLASLRRFTHFMLDALASLRTVATTASQFLCHIWWHLRPWQRRTSTSWPNDIYT